MTTATYLVSSNNYNDIEMSEKLAKVLTSGADDGIS